MSLDKVIANLIVVCGITLAICSCRSFQTKSSVESVNTVQDSFCNPAVEKQLICSVRDIVARNGSKADELSKSDLAKTSKVVLTVFPNSNNKSPQIEFSNLTESNTITRFENTTDLYHRNGCLAELDGGVFSEGFTPRASLKILLSAKNSDYAVIAEVSDFRFNKAIHFLLDLQCDRKHKL